MIIGNTRQDRINAAQRIPNPFSAVDTAPAFIIQAVTRPDDAISVATIQFTQGGDMTFLVAGIAPTGKWAIGTAGVVDTSAGAYNTVGEVADLINGTLGWRCILQGAERATLMAEILTKGATDAFVDAGLVFYSDTSASDEHAVAITGEAFVNTGINGHVKDWDDRCLNMLDDLQINIGVTGNGTVKLMSGKQGETEVDMNSYILTDDTLLEKGTDNPMIAFQAAPEGHRLIIKITAATSIDDFSVCNINGRSAPLTGSRVVSKRNY